LLHDSNVHLKNKEPWMLRLRSYLMAFVISCLVVFLPGNLAAQAGARVDVTGKWLFSVTTSAGTGTPAVTLKQQGDTLTGHYSSQTLGEADLKGTVKDGKINFSFRTEVQGTSLVVSYSGAVESNDALKGTVDIGGQATGTFTAKRQ
jgi:hypothetical protein